MKVNKVTKYIALLFIALAVAVSPVAHAFSLDAYTEQSVLANGRWQKISVETSGIHFIPAATLRSWGFSSPR